MNAILLFFLYKKVDNIVDCVNMYIQLENRSLTYMQNNIQYSNTTTRNYVNFYKEAQTLEQIHIAFAKTNAPLMYYTYTKNNSRVLVVQSPTKSQLELICATLSDPVFLKAVPSRPYNNLVKINIVSVV